MLKNELAETLPTHASAGGGIISSSILRGVAIGQEAHIQLQEGNAKTKVRELERPSMRLCGYDWLPQPVIELPRTTVHFIMLTA